MPRAESGRQFDSKSFLRTLTSRPGVYRMLGEQGEILYVGKARNLKKRVASYFRNSGLAPKTQALMRQMSAVDVTVTNTEAEALILENNLIKTHRPRYNVLLRDDKSYPFIYLSTEQTYPRLALHRGVRRGKGRYFGPYPDAGAVRESLHLLQRMFRVRQCQDSFFRNRSRPCLQYQIKRCNAPCVGLISPQDYAQDVHHTVLFLEGKSSALNDELVEKMEQAASSLDFEQAAVFRDQIASLRRVQERQYVSGESGDLDIVACVLSGGLACVQVFFVRKGVNLGNKIFFPKIPADSSHEDVLSAFLAQYYLAHPVPEKILMNCEPEGEAVLAEVLSEKAGRKVLLAHRVRGEKARWLQLGVQNAEQALAARLSSQAGMSRRLQLLQQVLRLDELPSRIECFDISHTQGEGTVASCVVFDREGPRKSDYRRFGIRDIVPGDDYAAMQQALLRRYTRIKKEDAKLPEVVLIDGGKGQLSSAQQVMEELQIDEMLLVGVSKGPERKPGMEILHIPSQQRHFGLEPSSPALHLIQPDTRRGAPVRNNRPPPEARPGARRFPAGGDPGRWSAAQAAAPETVRGHAGSCACRGRGSVWGARHQSYTGSANIRCVSWG